MRTRTLPALIALAASLASAKGALVLQTDFGTRDGAVSAMHGVALGIDPSLVVQDLSHENTPYDTWEAAYRLVQTAPWWPAGTVFVSVVDPGVGTARHSVVLRTRSGHLFVGPDNGSFTLVAEQLGIAEVREIEEERLHKPGRKVSATFHGRDVFAVLGARLASGKTSLEKVGPKRPRLGVLLPHVRPSRLGDTLAGGVPALDFRYGNVWSDIPDSLLQSLPLKTGDTLTTEVRHEGKPVWKGKVPFVTTFGDVEEGAPLLYVNSLGNLALALNMGDFAKAHGIASDPRWELRVSRLPRR